MIPIPCVDRLTRGFTWATAPAGDRQNPIQLRCEGSGSGELTRLMAATLFFSDEDSHSRRMAEMMWMPSDPNSAAMP